MGRLLEPVGQAIQAVVTETPESRDGSRRGVGGITEPRIFRVQLIIGEQDRTELRMPDPRGFVEAQIPYGSLHPWNGYARVIGYGPVRRITAQHYLVGVDYGVGGPTPATVQPDHRRWSLSVRSQAISQRLLEEPTTALLSWKVPFGLSDSRTAKGLYLGTSKFVADPATELPEPPPVEYWARLSKRSGERGEGPSVLYDQPLVRDGEKVQPFDYTAELPGLMFTMTRVFANFGLDGLGALADYRATINNTPFRGADIGHVKMADFTADEVGMVLDDGAAQREPGIAYRVMLAFLWSAVPFIGPYSPLAKVVTISDEHNDKAIVYKGALGEGEKYVEEFYPIRGMDFDAMIALVETLSGIRHAGPPVEVPG